MSISFRRSGEIMDFVVSRLGFKFSFCHLLLLANVFNPNLFESVSSSGKWDNVYMVGLRIGDMPDLEEVSVSQ